MITSGEFSTSKFVSCWYLSSRGKSRFGADEAARPVLVLM
jgi:hypothetical protein